MALTLPVKSDSQNHFRVSFSPGDCRPRVADVVRYLGGADYRPRPHILKRVDRALSLAEGVVAPAAVFSILPVRQADHTGVMLNGNRPILAGVGADWHQAAYILASVATLGPGLEAKCRALSRSAPFAAIVLDAVGVAFLDKLAVLVGRESQRQATSLGLHSGVRISPGLCNIDLSLQTELFDLVDSQALGVELTEDLIMKPFKSISELRAFTSRPPKPDSLDKCMHCDLMPCGFRRRFPKQGPNVDHLDLQVVNRPA